MPNALRLALLALLIGSSLPAADLKDELRDLHKLARGESDLWLCLQLEAYADRHEISLPSALGRGAMVHGQPVLSYPDRILTHFDRGDHVIVVAGNRVERVAPDGRPLALGSHLPFEAQRVALSPDGRFLAAGILENEGNQRILRLAVIDLQQDQQVLLQHRIIGVAVPPMGYWLNQVVIASDGSAAVGTVGQYGVPNPTRVAVLATAAEQQLLAGVQQVDAVGPGGSWLLSRVDGGHELVRGGGGAPSAVGWIGAERLASHGDLSLMRTSAGLLFISADGTPRPWISDLPGYPNEVHGIGDWLAVICNGRVNETPLVAVAAPDAAGGIDLLAPAGDSVDLLAPLPNDPAAPDSNIEGAILLYRWSDIIANPAAAPVYRLSGRGRRADGHAMSLLRWHHNQVDIIALGGAVPELQALYTAPANINDVTFQAHHYLVLMAEDACSVVDQRGRELASFPAEPGIRTVLRSRGAALRYRMVGEDQVTNPTITALATNPDERRTVTLADWPVGMQDYDTDVDDEVSVIVVGRGQQWMRYDPITGAIIDQNNGMDMRTKLPVARSNAASGRFYTNAYLSHLHSAVADLEDPDQPSWAIADVTMFGRNLLLLTADGTVRVKGRRDWQELGRHEQARRFKTDRTGKVLYVGPENGPALAELRPPQGLIPLDQPTQARPLDHGSWQVNNLRFTVPGKARPQQWDGANTGFRPERLHGIERNLLLAIFPGVVLQLDPSTADRMSMDPQQQRQSMLGRR